MSRGALVSFSTPTQFQTCSLYKFYSAHERRTMGKQLTALCFIILFLSCCPLQCDAWLGELAGAVIGGGAVLLGAPIALGAVGFGGTIAAGSWAASMMSAAATTGYGMGAVAALQSAGAAGVGAATVIAGAATGAGVGHYASSHSKEDKDD